jgi:hypothetical protein
MELSAPQAAKKVGKSVPTITISIKKGKLAAKGFVYIKVPKAPQDFGY